MLHPSGVIPDAVVRKVLARRGRLHAFESLNPAATALVVIDLDIGSCRRDPTCQTMVPTINTLAAAVRAGSGAVAWITSRAAAPSPVFAAIVGDELAHAYYTEQRPGQAGSQLWPDLDAQPGDIHAVKAGGSAFFPGRCDLPEALHARGVDTVLIAGTATNICCDSSARDATELQFKVIMVSDACAGQAFGLHEASLTTFYRIYGDVRPATEVIGLLAGTCDMRSVTTGDVLLPQGTGKACRALA